jgi:hypothetical protein
MRTTVRDIAKDQISIEALTVSLKNGLSFLKIA